MPISDNPTLEELETVCLPCKAGFHNECTLGFAQMLEEDEECCCHGTFTMALYQELDAELERIQAGSDEDLSGRGEGRVKTPGAIKDWESTGRKRAAEIAPIFEGMVCEAAFLKFAGGGVNPIVGCAGSHIFAKPEDKSLRGDRHHGPDKNVLNNAPGVNLHRWCTTCHNRWHAINDKFYDLDTGKSLRPKPDTQYFPSAPYWLHDPITRANEAEYDASEEWWDTPAGSRPDYPFTPETPPVFPQEKDEEDGKPSNDN